MKRVLQYLVVVIVLFFLCNNANAALNISYTNPAAYTLGTAIPTLSPTVTGGTVTTGSLSPIYSFGSVANPYDVTVDAAGNVYTMSESGATLIKTTPTGTMTTLNNSTLNQPVGVAIDALGNIYVSDFGDQAVYVFNTSGTLLKTITGFNQPYGIAFDASNNAYVVDLGLNKVFKIAAGTSVATSFISTGLSSPYGIAVDPSGNLYVSQYLANNIIKITPGGVQSVFATGFNAPRQLGSDGLGNIYVADFGNNAIKKVSAAGVVTTIAAASGLSTPRSVQVDASGSIYIADFGNNAIKKVAVTGYIISAPLPSGLSFNTSTGQITGTPLVTFASTSYTIIAYNAAGKSNVATVTVSCTQNTITWDGSSNTIWTNPANWTPATVPGVNDAVQIGVATYTNQPAISSNVTVNSITFGKKKAVVLSIAAGNTLTITGNLTVQTGEATTISQTGVGTAAAVNMSPGSIVTLTTTGTLAISSPVSFTLQSDATGDASIGQITSTGTITGNVNVQRYLSGGSASDRGYRLLSSPVTSGSGGYTINYLKNTIYLTGTLMTGGFDNTTTTANPTLYLYRENLTTPVYTTFIGSNFRGINDISTSPTYGMDDATYPTTTIPVGTGYLCFFRGNRATTTFAAETVTSYVPQAATLSAGGTLNIGQITTKDWFNSGATTLSYTGASPVAGFNLVGNPYASAIDWDTYQTTTTTTAIYGKNLTGVMYVLDPVSKNFGSYIPGSGGIGSATFVSNKISSGQGFFVMATAATAKLIFNESAKTISQNTGITLLMSTSATPLATNNNQYLRLQMGQDSITSDQTLIRFNKQATRAYAATLDAPYVAGFGAVSLATKSSDQLDLSINTIPLPQQQQETIALNVNVKNDGVYTMTLKDVVAVPKLFDIWLMDAYKKDSLDMRHNRTYSFNVYKTDSASVGPKRFSLVMRQNPAYAYRLLNFAASKVQDAPQVQVIWKTENEQNYTNFTVERSIDNGKTFNVVASQVSVGQGTYSILDKNPSTGLNEYRLKQEDINNTISYSNIIPVQISKFNAVLFKGSINVYPNPANSNINVSVKDAINSSAYNIRITNSSGLLLKQANSAQGSWQTSINDLMPGTYIIKVFNSKDNTLIGDSKFVKL